ncbi:MAG TPA: conjugal transfer protein TraL, partial [Dysgonomonas sp.]|nr:conjugal transfer protein TraL [Dysgonomonas sp.]
MRQFISKIKDRVEDGLRRVCAPMGPGTRILVIVVLVAVFAVCNFYIMFRA